MAGAYHGGFLAERSGTRLNAAPGVPPCAPPRPCAIARRHEQRPCALAIASLCELGGVARRVLIHARERPPRDRIHFEPAAARRRERSPKRRVRVRAAVRLVALAQIFEAAAMAAGLGVSPTDQQVTASGWAPKTFAFGGEHGHHRPRTPKIHSVWWPSTARHDRQLSPAPSGRFTGLVNCDRCPAIPHATGTKGPMPRRLVCRTPAEALAEVSR